MPTATTLRISKPSMSTSSQFISSTTYMTNAKTLSPVESGPISNDVTTFVILGAIVAAVVFVVFVCGAGVVIIIIVVKRRLHTSRFNQPERQMCLRNAGIDANAGKSQAEHNNYVEINMQEAGKSGTQTTEMRNSTSTFQISVPVKETEPSEASTIPQIHSTTTEVEEHELSTQMTVTETSNEVSKEKISLVASDTDTVTEESKNEMDSGISTEAVDNGTSTSDAPPTYENNLDINK